VEPYSFCIKLDQPEYRKRSGDVWDGVAGRFVNGVRLDSIEPVRLGHPRRRWYLRFARSMGSVLVIFAKLRIGTGVDASEVSAVGQG